MRVEHLVDDHPPIDVLTGADGRWDLPNIAGGRYRVRSFLAPTLAQTEPEIFFILDGEQRSLDLTVESFAQLALAAAVAPDPPQLNQPVTFVVRVARKTVDPSGVVQSQPVPGAAVALTNAPGWQARGSASTVADGNGDAVFTLECRSAGAAQLQVSVRPTLSEPPQVATLEVSPCADPTATTTTTATASSGAPPPTSTQTSSASGPPPN